MRDVIDDAVFVRCANKGVGGNWVVMRDVVGQKTTCMDVGMAAAAVLLLTHHKNQSMDLNKNNEPFRRSP